MSNKLYDFVTADNSKTEFKSYTYLHIAGDLATELDVSVNDATGEEIVHVLFGVGYDFGVPDLMKDCKTALVKIQVKDVESGNRLIQAFKDSVYQQK